MNPFITIHEFRHGSDYDRIGTGWEDTLTENLAHHLRVDVEAQDAVVRALLGADAGPIAAIKTQYQVGSDRPDIAIEFDSGQLLLIECKVDAGLGPRQLERYLEVETPDGHESLCALISRHHHSISPKVLGSPRYLRPEERNHWLWQDLYSLIPRPERPLGAHHLRRQFLDYLELLGLAPSDLAGRWERLLDDDEEAREARIAFGALLGGVRKWFEEMEFGITGDSQSGIQVKPRPTYEHRGDYIWFTISPAIARRHLMDPEFSHRVTTSVFRVSLVYDSPVPPAEAEFIHSNFPRPLIDPNGFKWWPVAPYRMRNRRTRVEVVASLEPFIGDGLNIDDRLTRGCVLVSGELLRLAAMCCGANRGT